VTPRQAPRPLPTWAAGAYFSINASQARSWESLRLVPPERLLLETDHPFGDRSESPPAVKASATKPEMIPARPARRPLGAVPAGTFPLHQLMIGYRDLHWRQAEHMAAHHWAVFSRWPAPSAPARLMALFVVQASPRTD
jgi:hypothetical protein